MNEIKIGDIRVVNVNAKDADLFEESACKIIKTILTNDPNAEYIYCVNVKTDGDVNNTLKNLSRVRQLFIEQGINNLIIFPDSTIEISAVKVIHEYKDDKGELI